MEILIGVFTIIIAILAVRQIFSTLKTLSEYKAEKRRLQQNRSVWKPQNKQE